ncbi:MAG: hypothetical protein ATN35_12290 [Epulopiscium sp. Nele67-Bin004]|nr:MAG: hypothetical protein ATN35_12290 [Epulopiscium sp. Nele67-Bin004]
MAHWSHPPTHTTLWKEMKKARTDQNEESCRTHTQNFKEDESVGVRAEKVHTVLKIVLPLL